MATTFPDGSVVGFAQTIGVSIPFSATSNADPGVITVAADAVADDAVVAIIESRWPGLKNLATRVEQLTSTTALLRGIDTSDTELFVPGAGSGRLVVATDWMDFSQQGELTAAGGEPQTYTGKYLEDPLGQEFQVPIGQSARTSTLQLDYDRELPWYKAAKTVSRRKKPTVIRVVLPNGDTIYEWGFLHFNGSLPLTAGQPIRNTATFYFQGGEGVLVELA